MFEFMRNLFASEQPTLEKYNVVDPTAVGDKVRSITIAFTPPIDDIPKTSVSLFWSDSENKVYEKDFENQEEAKQIFDSIHKDLKEAAELTKEEKLVQAEDLMKSLLDRYDVYTDKLIDGNPPPMTTTNASKKKAKVVMQNVFFDSPEEAVAYQEKMKKNEPEKLEDKPMAGDFVDDLSKSDKKDTEGLPDMADDEEIGPPSLSHKDFEKNKAEEQKSLTKRIEREVKDQVQSALDEKVSSSFSKPEDDLVEAMRGMGRTWEEIREYFVKEFKYDEDTVVYYLDKKKEEDNTPKAPKPSEDLISPEVHDQLIDEVLEDKPKLEEPVLTPKELSEKDIPIRKEPEIANKFNVEIGKKAENPLETVPPQSAGTSDDMEPKVDFQTGESDIDQITDMPSEIGENPNEDLEEIFNAGDNVYVMGDYETGTNGYDGKFLSQYTMSGEDYAIIALPNSEEKEVPLRFVKKASYKEFLRKKAEKELAAAPKCNHCTDVLNPEEYMVCNDCKQKVKDSVKEEVTVELNKRALSLIIADIEDMKTAIPKWLEDSTMKVMDTIVDPLVEIGKDPRISDLETKLKSGEITQEEFNKIKYDMFHNVAASKKKADVMDDAFGENVDDVLTDWLENDITDYAKEDLIEMFGSMQKLMVAVEPFLAAFETAQSEDYEHNGNGFGLFLHDQGFFDGLRNFRDKREEAENKEWREKGVYDFLKDFQLDEAEKEWFYNNIKGGGTDEVYMQFKKVPHGYILGVYSKESNNLIQFIKRLWSNVDVGDVAIPEKLVELGRQAAEAAKVPFKEEPLVTASKSNNFSKIADPINPTMQPATKPSETEEKVPTKYKELKISPRDTKKKEVELADEDAQKAYNEFKQVKQRLASINTIIDGVKQKANVEIQKIKEEQGQANEQVLFQEAVEKVASLVEATKDNVMRAGEELFTLINERKMEKVKLSDSQRVKKLLAHFEGAAEYLKQVENGSQSLAKEVTKRELIKSPIKESSNEKVANVRDILEGIWDGLKRVYTMFDQKD